MPTVNQKQTIQMTGSFQYIHQIKTAVTDIHILPVTMSTLKYAFSSDYTDCQFPDFAVMNCSCFVRDC